MLLAAVHFMHELSTKQPALKVLFCTVMPGTKLQEHSGSDKAWVWSTMDFATEEQRMELFCLKLPSPASKLDYLLSLFVDVCSTSPKLYIADFAHAIGLGWVTLVHNRLALLWVA